MTFGVVGNKWAWGAVAVLAATISLTLQGWVGYHTIYAPEGEADRLRTHTAILHNELPAGTTWEELGASGTTIRRVNVELAEFIANATGMTIERTYLITDTFFLFSTFFFLFAFLSQMMPAQWGLVGILLYASILPITYYSHYFHPWDRLSLSAWLLFLIALRAGRFWVLAPILFVSITIKYDMILLPGLYFMATVERDRWHDSVWRSALLAVVAFGTYFGLLALYPQVTASLGIAEQVSKNLHEAVALGLRYPPLLVFAPALLFAALGWKDADRFVRSCALFAVLLFVPFFLRSNFVEVRAEMPAWILLLPAMMLGLRRTLDRAEAVD